MTRVLTEAGFAPNMPVMVRSDNQSAIKWASGERCPSSRAKHIDVRIHYIRNMIKGGEIEMTYIPSEENDADMLTKPLGRILLGRILKRIQLGDSVEEEC